MIKAIETQYRGYRFRSRLEARWAVFFDARGWRWEYEKEGYNLDGVKYLPDFWLPDAEVFVEVKPTFPVGKDLQKITALAQHHQIVVVIGQPDSIAYPLFDKESADGWSVYFVWHHGEVGNFELYFDEWGESSRTNFGHHYQQAVEAARGARFEHGESGHP